MNLTHPIEPDELGILATHFGSAPHEHAVLAVDEPFLNGEHQTLLRDGRRAEICYIMHRGDPAQGVLLHVKNYYPSGAFRLPTGGVQVGEGVLETVTREIYEETGLDVGNGPDHVHLQRYLGVLSYDFRHRSLGRTFTFATYHFLVEAPATAAIEIQDESEQILAWQWRSLVELPLVAHNLDSLHSRLPEWTHWGRFRALSHHFVNHHLTPPVP